MLLEPDEVLPRDILERLAGSQLIRHDPLVEGVTSTGRLRRDAIDEPRDLPAQLLPGPWPQNAHLLLHEPVARHRQAYQRLALRVGGQLLFGVPVEHSDEFDARATRLEPLRRTRRQIAAKRETEQAVRTVVHALDGRNVGVDHLIEGPVLVTGSLHQA